MAWIDAVAQSPWCAWCTPGGRLLAARRRSEQFDWDQVFPRLWDHYANVLGKSNPVATPAG